MSQSPTGMVKALTDQGNWLFRYRGQAPIPILLAVLAVGLAVGPQPWGRFQIEPWEAFGVFLGLLGIFVRALAIGFAAPGTSGSNTDTQIAESLNTDGLYSVVRHPLYLGNMIMWVGVGAYAGSWPVALIAALSFLLLYERIMIAEEHFLDTKFGPQFTAWTERTPALFPALPQWTPPAAALSIKRILRREYSSLLSFLVAITLVEVAQNVRWGYGAIPEPAWAAGPMFGLFVCLTIRTLKKSSNLLDLDGDDSGANRT